MAWFRSKTPEEANKALAEKEQRPRNNWYSSYKEKQTQRAEARKTYVKGLTKNNDVEKDYRSLGRGATAGLSGGMLYGRMVRRRK